MSLRRQTLGLNTRVETRKRQVTNGSNCSGSLVSKDNIFKKVYIQFQFQRRRFCLLLCSFLVRFILLLQPCFILSENSKTFLCTTDVLYLQLYMLNVTHGRPVAVMKFNPMAESLEFLLALPKALVFINWS